MLAAAEESALTQTIEHWIPDLTIVPGTLDMKTLADLMTMMILWQHGCAALAMVEAHQSGAVVALKVQVLAVIRRTEL